MGSFFYLATMNMLIKTSYTILSIHEAHIIMAKQL